MVQWSDPTLNQSDPCKSSIFPFLPMLPKPGHTPPPQSVSFPRQLVVLLAQDLKLSLLAFLAPQDKVSMCQKP